VAQVVCQVVHKPGRMSILWSAGAQAFEPIHLEGDALTAFEQTARRARIVLTDAALGDQAAVGELSQLGRDLHARFFAAGVGPEVATWLRGLSDVASLEIGADTPGRVPFAVFEDPEQPGPWGTRFALAVGRRANPLRTFNQIAAPRVVVVRDPGITLDDATRTSVDQFVAQDSRSEAASALQLEELLARNVPDIVWMLTRIDDGAWLIGADRITPEWLADVVSGAEAGNSLPIVLSTNVGGPELCAAFERFLGAATSAIPGLVAFETPVAAPAACASGLAFLQRLLDDKMPVARAVQQFRLSVGPEGLSFATFTPPHVRVVNDDEAGGGPPRRPLPDEPYHPLRALEREDRALLFGRDDDIQRCALLIDQPNTAAVLIHGQAGVGKASLVRAGLLPFLEEENRGFFVLRDRSEPAPDGKEVELPTLALRAGPDLAGSLVLGLTAFAARPFVYTTPTGRSVRVDLPAIAQRFVSGSPVAPDTAVQRLDGDAVPAAPVGIAQADPALIWDHVQQRPASLARLVDWLTRELPFELLIPVEQLDDIAVLPAAKKHDALAAEVLRGLAKSPARATIVATLRTEHVGAVNALVGENAALAGWREYYLNELSHDAAEDALAAPTATDPPAYASEVPAAKYGFGFEPRALKRALDHVKEEGKASGYSSIQVVQAVGKQLFDLCARRSVPAATENDVKRIVKDGVVGGLIETALKKMPIPSAEAKALKGLFAKLQRSRGGVVTRHLTPVAQLKSSWRASLPLEQACNVASEHGPLLEIQNLLVGGRDETLVTVPQDSLAVFGAEQVQNVAKEKFARSKFNESLYVIIPLAILAMALTYYLTRRFIAVSGGGEQIDLKKYEQALDRSRDIGALGTRFAVYSGAMAQAESALRQGNTLRARQLLASQQPGGMGNDLRGFEWFHLWRQINGEDAVLLGHKSQARVLAMSLDGKLLASGDEAGGVFLWNLDDLKEPMSAVLKGLKGPVQALAFAPDGSAVAGTDGGFKVTVWDNLKPGKSVVDLEPKATLPAEGALSLAFVGGADSLAVGDQEKRVTLFDVAGAKAKWTSGEHTGPVRALVAIKDDKALASASDKELIVWNADGKKEQAVALEAGFRVAGLAWLAGKKDELLVAGTSPLSANQPTGVDAVRSLNFEKKTLEPLNPRVALGSSAAALAVIPGANLVAAADDLHAIHVWENPGEARNEVRGHVSAIRSLAGGGSRLASVGFDNAIKIWDAKKLAAPDVVQTGALAGIALDSSERLVASAGYDGKIQFWEAATGRRLGEIKAAVGTSCVALSRGESPLLLAAGAGNDVLMWEVSLDKDGVKAKELPALKGHKEAVTCVAFASDAKKTLASGSGDRTAIVWDVAAAKPAHVLPHESALRVLSFEGPILLTGDTGGSVRLWNAANGNVLGPAVSIQIGAVTGVQPLSGVGQVAFVSTGLDQSVRIWGKDQSGQSFANFKIYRNHHQPVTALAQGKGFFVTGAADGSVKTWDPTLQDERFTYRDHDRAVRTVIVTKNNDLVISAGDDGRIVFRRGVARPMIGPANVPVDGGQ
jgi:WD40 repeat protein